MPKISRNLSGLHGWAKVEGGNSVFVGYGSPNGLGLTGHPVGPQEKLGSRGLPHGGHKDGVEFRVADEIERCRDVVGHSVSGDRQARHDHLRQIA